MLQLYYVYHLLLLIILLLLLLYLLIYIFLFNYYFHNNYFNIISNIFIWSCFHHNDTRQFVVSFIMVPVLVQAYCSVIIINSTAPSELNHVGVPECMGVCTHWLVVLLLLWCLFFFFFF